MMRALAIAAALTLAAPVWASTEAWEDIRHALYEDRELLPGEAYIALHAPYRTDNDPRTIIGAEVRAPGGALIEKVTLILDENPMPVSAVLDLTRPQSRFSFETTMRVNGSTPVHVVAEMTDGSAYMIEGYVKTSGTGACAAPPGTDPLAALETLGDMVLSLAPDAARGDAVRDALAQLDGQTYPELSVDLSHPSHSGMQKDQISLLFIPMRYVSDLNIGVNGAPFAEMTGSISLSENPSVRLSVPRDAETATVQMTDTDGAVTESTTSIRLY